MTDLATKKVNREINIRQLAREMKVAICTVSRALAGEPGVSKKRAEEIRRKAVLMGYRPQPLRRKRTNAIAMLISTDQPSIADDLFQQLITLHLERNVGEFNNHVHVEFIARNSQGTAWPAILAENRVDGVVLTGHPTPEFCRRIREAEIPVVAINDTVARTGCSCVLTDFTAGTAQMTRKLLTLGHRDIGMVLTRRDYPSVETRYQGYIKSLRERGIEPDQHLIFSGLSPNLLGGQQAVAQYLQSGKLPTAIIFTNDWMAMGGLNELLHRGYRVPEDVSIAGHDNISICRELHPPLTSVDGQIDLAVAEAVRILNGHINGEKEIVQKEIPAFAVWRESCGEVGKK